MGENHRASAVQGDVAGCYRRLSLKSPGGAIEVLPPTPMKFLKARNIARIQVHVSIITYSSKFHQFPFCGETDSEPLSGSELFSIVSGITAFKFRLPGKETDGTTQVAGGQAL